MYSLSMNIGFIFECCIVDHSCNKHFVSVEYKYNSHSSVLDINQNSFLNPFKADLENREEMGRLFFST
jgi:hypothetical protein